MGKDGGLAATACLVGVEGDQCVLSRIPAGGEQRLVAGVRSQRFLMKV